jgi:dTDP-4-dehydrorhamnose 3,5-epimerase
MQIIELSIPDVKVLTPKKFGDARGYFCETYSEKAFAAIGIVDRFVQDNHSLSVPVGTLRGLHFQLPPFAQAKLVRVVRGAIFDVAVDIRPGSPSFGKWCGATISAELGNQILLPVGFAHGFVTLEPNTEVVYKVTNFYDPASDRGMMWNDPAIGIEWPLLEQAPEQGPLLSDKDQKHPLLADLADDVLAAFAV